MVVGIAKYKNQSEAFPLDKKTLNKVALRSFLAGATYNGETANSLGFVYAIKPALEKIHTDAEDYALSLGHNLEYVHASSSLSTYAMGVTLALEQQKADLETIRSCRTMASETTEALGGALRKYVLFPLLALALLPMAECGSTNAVIAYALVALLVNIVVRIIALRVGYTQTMRNVEKNRRSLSKIKKSSSLGASFLLGGMMIFATYNIVPHFEGYFEGLHYTFSNAMKGVFPGFISVVVCYGMYQLLNKKNFSLGKCVLILLLISAVLTFLTSGFLF